MIDETNACDQIAHHSVLHGYQPEFPSLKVARILKGPGAPARVGQPTLAWPGRDRPAQVNRAARRTSFPP